MSEPAKFEEMEKEIPTDRKQSSAIDSQSVPPAALKFLFAVHAILTGAAGVVLIVAPDSIPNAVGISLEPQAYLVCYLLAAAELGFATLSIGARTLTDSKALRLIALACLVFHAASGLLEIYAFAKGASAAIWGNVAVRAVVVFLFAYYGLYKISQNDN